MVKTQKSNKEHTISKPSLKNIKTNNLLENESQVTNIRITENKIKKSSNRTNVKKKKENKEPSLADSDNGIVLLLSFYNIQGEQASNVSSNSSLPSIRSRSPKNFYSQYSLTTQSLLAERHSPEISISDKDDSSKSLQKNFFNGESLHLQDNFSDIEQEDFSEKSQYINDDLECSSFIASDTSSSSNQSTSTEDFELQMEEEKKFNQIIVDSGLDFQPLSEEYGPYFKNFTEMSLFTWVTMHMITTKQYKDLATIIQHPKFNPKHIPSISISTKNVYTISVSEYLKRVLGNKGLRSQMYFGPGVKAEMKEEFWHSKIWQKSPLIGLSSISINNELWLSKVTYLINLPTVIGLVTVWLQDTLEPPAYQFCVREILYTHEGQWKIRNCKLRHYYPIEYIQIPASAPNNKPILKIMLDIYYDDFGFVLFGVKFDDVMKPIVNEIKDLEKDTLMKIKGQDMWIVAGLGVITADLSQGNDLADTKCHSGSLGYRSCLVSKE
ncbi:36581_t:CDS:2 [Racocetra persica]|uniref:36581_t:CDS:1 n=1 Tax=Racocetra persica TaxID=160502 RepID=A0ACA9K9X1_9GLOM|nr:36581_t:CDS:2 [Racocetra persica]